VRFVPVSLDRLKVAAAVVVMTSGVFFAFRLVGVDAGPVTAPRAPSVDRGGLVHAWTTTTETAAAKAPVHGVTRRVASVPRTSVS